MIDTSALRHVTTETNDEIQTIVLANPEKRNPLSRAAMDELRELLEAAGKNTAIKVVVVRALGPAFSAGHDLREVRRASEEANVSELRDIFDTCVRLMTAIQTIPQPVIAQVSGIATAAGCQFVAACDLAIAESGARFATPGVKIGLFCTTPMVALTRAIGRKHAMEMLLLGDFIDAQTAESWGLINRVVAPEDLERETQSIARRIASSSSFTIGLGKQAFYAQIDLDQPKAYAYAKEVMSMNALDADAREGIAAFLERRAPNGSRRREAPGGRPHDARLFWDSLYGLIFGFLISAIAQTVASRGAMERALGPGARGIVSGTVFGIVASACSYGAAAAARGFYQKGADVRAVFAFMISSTNMNVAILIMFWRCSVGSSRSPSFSAVRSSSRSFASARACCCANICRHRTSARSLGHERNA